MTAVPQGFTAVMAQRRSDPRALDLFPTPPWATRALLQDVLGTEALKHSTVWEPAAGLGTMSEVLKEYAAAVIASDVHDYEQGHIIGSFVGDGLDVVDSHGADWIITNPPFNLALPFARRANEIAREGVALLVRSVWAEGGERYRALFSQNPPSIIAQFCERVPMVQGRWDPKATTATSYAWFIWQKRISKTEFRWIPPGARQRCSRSSDVDRFAA